MGVSHAYLDIGEDESSKFHGSIPMTLTVRGSAAVRRAKKWSSYILIWAATNKTLSLGMGVSHTYLDIREDESSKVHGSIPMTIPMTFTERGSAAVRRAKQWADHNFVAVPAKSIKQVQMN
jgi:hypothetical protein